jgi:hypothetical protein
MRRIRSILATALALTIAGSGSAAAGSSQERHFDGEQLFTGLFLAQGPAAQTYPQLRLAHRQGVDAVQARALTSRMRQLSPAFFDTFRSDLTSGDRVRIDRAARQAGELAAKAAGPSPVMDGPNGSFIVVNKTVVKQSHMVVNQNKYWNGDPTVESELARERWVDDVAETLER